MNELFFSVTEKDRLLGYTKDGPMYRCLLCDFTTEEGYIYPKGPLHVDAKKQMVLHIEEVHGGVFNYLLTLDKKMTGLSEHQRKIMAMFYQGYSDYEVKEKLNIGSVSTIRNHRYMLKEKEKQAKTMVTLMRVLSENMDPKKMPVKIHRAATMVDKRYDMTLDEAEKTLKKYFLEGGDGPLKVFPAKEKNKLIVLKEIIKRFKTDYIYTEKEVDDILKGVYDQDHVVIRRYLIEYGFMNREKDCSAYWKTQEVEAKKMKTKDQKISKRKELVEAYMAKTSEEGVESGVYQIQNLENNKIFIGTARNIRKLEGLLFQLNTGSFINKALQKEWTSFGEDKFEITLLEAFDEEKENNVQKKLKDLERSYKEKLQPFGEKGYHKIMKR